MHNNKNHYVIWVLSSLSNKHCASHKNGILNNIVDRVLYTTRLHKLVHLYVQYMYICLCVWLVLVRFIYENQV